MVDITDDSVTELTESFTVELSNPSAGATIDTPSETVTILDDDTPTPAHVGFDVASYSVGQGGDVTVTVDRTANIDSSVNVDYATLAQGATAGLDFVADADTLDFDPGDTSQSFTISTVSDTLHEGDETFQVKLSNALPSGGPNATIIDLAKTTVTIVDDDPIPTISTGGASTGDGTVTFPVSLSNPTTTDVTVNYVITDCNGNVVATGTATNPAGQSGISVTAPVTGCGPWTVVISNPTGGTIDPGTGSTTTPVATPVDPGTPAAFDPGAATQPAGDAPATDAGNAVAPVMPGANQTVLAAGPSVCRLTVKAAPRVDHRKGLVVKLRAGRACTVTLGASVKGTDRKNSNSTRVIRALKTKRQSVKLAKGQVKTVKLRFSKRALGFIRRALQARRPMTLTLAVIERDGAKRVTKRTARTKLHR